MTDNKIDPIDVWARAKKLGKDQKYFARVHNRSVQQVSQAFNEKQPGLLKRIIRHIEFLESRQHANS